MTLCRAIVAVVMLGTTAGSFAADTSVDPFANPPTPAFEGQTGSPAPAAPSAYTVEVLASGLERPRSLAALPDGNLLVVDGKGEARIVGPDGEMSRPLRGMPAVRSVSGRGLMDVIPAYDFAESRTLFLAYPSPPPGERGGPVSAERRSRAVETGELFQVDTIARARLADNNRRIRDVEVIAELPARRMVQAPDGTLFITTMGFGLGNSDASQDVQKLTSARGKTLRINPDGSIPEDNPYYGITRVRQEIWSWGHRDPDGAMIHPETGELWTIEHGPMGGDELNRIIANGNYGWPYVTYGKNYDGSEIGPSERTGIEQPLYYWFPSLAVSGLMMYTGDMFPEWQGNVFLGAMSPSQGKFLVRLVMDGDRVVAEEHLLADRDRRVRDVEQGADGALYVLTDSEDAEGRNFPGEVLRLTPQ